MYAIFRAGGKQFRAEPGATIRIPNVVAEPGETLTFDEVLFGANDGEFKLGAPLVDGAAVTAEVVKHGKGEKIVIFKHKRRKNYRRKLGHRQQFTEIRVSEINLG
jgi:large subunit ribosomal protein L21